MQQCPAHPFDPWAGPSSSPRTRCLGHCCPPMPGHLSAPVEHLQCDTELSSQHLLSLCAAGWQRPQLKWHLLRCSRARPCRLLLDLDTVRVAPLPAAVIDSCFPAKTVCCWLSASARPLRARFCSLCRKPCCPPADSNRFEDAAAA